MKLLFDTHTFLWWAQNNTRLSATARAAIADPENTILLSVITPWEMMIKSGLGKLSLQGAVQTIVHQQLRRHGFTLLSVRLEHTLYNLPFHHKDPFDRLLIAQALEEGATLVTDDGLITQYGVQTLW